MERSTAGSGLTSVFDFSKNHFEVFGLSVGFLVDTDSLTERYRDLQKIVHPDRYANGSAQERRMSLQYATQINEAFETLKDPQRRAIYLLSLLLGQDTASGHGTGQDAAFLMEQMELRQALAEIKAEPDPMAALETLLDRIASMIKAITARLAVQFEDGSAAQLEAARDSVGKLQFLNNLHSEAEQLEAELEETL